MKALFFDKDLFMGMRVVERPQSEYKMAMPKNWHTNFEGEPLDQLSKPSMIKVIYRLEDYGKEFCIYKLYGYED
jgi:hypothetical protein